MLKRVLIALTLVAVGAGAAAVIFAAFIVPHEARGTVNTAASGVEELYICQPSGTTLSPACPIDSAGADEDIFVGAEDLIPGSVRWQKIRLSNVGTDPWDLLDMTISWSEVSDPGGLCNIVPEEVRFVNEATVSNGSQGPGVTVLGKPQQATDAIREPVEGAPYRPNYANNDNHGTVNGSSLFNTLVLNQSRTVHVEPGDVDDLLLGIRLPITATADCLNVVWQLTTTYEVQPHTP